ncbi:MAG: hypothetical protein M0025_12130 [Elusimicrobia bacterium]|nr:hypothetical protein [Elusimicrobiota bacterium]
MKKMSAAAASAAPAAISLLLAGALFPPPARALVVAGSKHDLSPGSGTSQTCIFCHTAHQAKRNVPLWNHYVTTQTFTFYSSNHLNTYLAIAAPTMADLPGTRTELCLSCHDGMTALGGLYNLGGETISKPPAVTGPANLGTNLADDHPVLYDVKPGAGPPGSPGTDPEIQLPLAGDAVKVYGAANRVECTSCHDPHDNQFGHFLVKSNANAAICTTCHIKSGFSASAHATSVVAYTPPGEAATTVGEWSCRNCHRSHGASATQAYILRGAEEATCYQCHGNPPLAGARNMQALFLKASRHPTETVSARHKDPETDGSNFTYSPLNNRHAECQDCHNPHQAKTGTHTAPANNISNVLLGQWGVEPSDGAIWTAAIAYVRQVFANTTGYKEYQLCLKCHSYYAFGAIPAPNITDQTVEFNINNKAAHPVRAGLSGQTGSVAPKALTAGQMSAPWTTAGTQTMYCSDCHDSDVAADPKGPHGSAGTWLKKGPNVYWPRDAALALYTLGANNTTDAHLAGLFCRNCHPLRSATANTWYNNAHQEHSGAQVSNVPCVACHVVVPHGSRRGRLIGYAAESAPYNNNGAGTLEKLVLSGFKKATTPVGYVTGNCYSTVAGCSSVHTNAGGYDP